MEPKTDSPTKAVPYVGYLVKAWRLFVGVWNASGDRHVGVIAAGVAFYGMFAVFPGMAATIAIWSIFADPAVIQSYLSEIRDVMPSAAFDVLQTQLTALLSAKPGTLGWATAISLGVAFYSVHNGVAALISALDAISGYRSRSAFRKLAGSVLLTFAILGLAILALATVVIVPVVLGFFPIGIGEVLILRVLPWAVLIFVLMIFLGMMYRWGPNAQGARLPWFTPGSFLAAGLWAAASIAFSVYLANFGNYNRIYGSIGAVIALLMWFYISGYIVLLGAILNAEIVRQRSPQ